MTLPRPVVRPDPQMPSALRLTFYAGTPSAFDVMIDLVEAEQAAWRAKRIAGNAALFPGHRFQVSFTGRDGRIRTVAGRAPDIDHFAHDLAANGVRSGFRCLPGFAAEGAR